MATGVRFFHSRINLNSYVLVKPTETKAFLYKLNKDGSINENAKPLLEKTYDKYCIKRKGKFPYTENETHPHRDNICNSMLPRCIKDIPDNMSQMFRIKNKDGMTGATVDVSGSINNKGKVVSVEKLKFPLEGYDLIGITNLARIYLKKIFYMYSATPANKNTYYISPKMDKILQELDKESNLEPFKITDKIKNSIDELARKHNIKIS